MVLVLPGMMRGDCLRIGLAVHTGLSIILYGVTTLRGGSVSSSIGRYVVDVGILWFCATLGYDTGVGLGGSIASLGLFMLNVDASCFNAVIYLFTICVSGLVRTNEGNIGLYLMMHSFIYPLMKSLVRSC